MNVLVYEPLLLSLLSLYSIVNIRMINPMIVTYVTSSNRSTFHQFTEISPWCSFTFGFSIISLLYIPSVCLGFFWMLSVENWPFSRCSWTIPCSKLWAGAAKASPWRFPKWGYPERNRCLPWPSFDPQIQPSFDHGPLYWNLWWLGRPFWVNVKIPNGNSLTQRRRNGDLYMGDVEPWNQE